MALLCRIRSRLRSAFRTHPLRTMAIWLALMATVFLTRDRWEAWQKAYELPPNVEWKECHRDRLFGFHDDGRALLIDIETGAEVASYEDCRKGSRATFSPDGSLLLLHPKVASFRSRERTLIVDVATGRVVRDLGVLKSLDLDMAFSPDGDRIFLCRREGDAAILHLRKPEKDVRFSPPVKAPRMARFSPDGRTLVAVLRGHRVMLLDALTGERLRALRCDEQIRLAEENPGASTLPRDWDDGDFAFQQNGVCFADFLGDGLHAVIVREWHVMEPQVAYVFDVATGRQVAEMRGQEFQLIQDRNVLTAGSVDWTTFNFFDPVSGRLIKSMPRPSAEGGFQLIFGG